MTAPFDATHPRTPECSAACNNGTDPSGTPDADVRLRDEVPIRLRPLDERLDRIANRLDQIAPANSVFAGAGIVEEAITVLRVEAQRARENGDTP